MKNEESCKAREALDLFRGKFSLEILIEIFHENNHFSQLLRSIPEINSRILSKRLRQFEAENILERIVLEKKPPQSICYKLTKKGLALQEIVAEMIAWREKFEG